MVVDPCAHMMAQAYSPFSTCSSSCLGLNTTTLDLFLQSNPTVVKAPPLVQLHFPSMREFSRDFNVSAFESSFAGPIVGSLLVLPLMSFVQHFE
jgi:hypothetical protein